MFDYQVHEGVLAGRLVNLFPEKDWGDQNIHAVYHDKMSNSPKVRAFIEFYSKAYEGHIPIPLENTEFGEN